MMALTATATCSDIADIKQSLCCASNAAGIAEVRMPYERANLLLLVRRKPHRCAAHAQLATYCKNWQANQAAGIVYARRRQEAESLAFMLQTRGVRAEAYHSALPSGVRSRTAQAWLVGELPRQWHACVLRTWVLKQNASVSVCVS